jgi:hypothetical protein
MFIGIYLTCKRQSFVARWGAACGTPFDAKKFLEQHPQYDWMNGLLKYRPTQTTGNFFVLLLAFPAYTISEITIS